jgi:hypothetical protein
MGRKRFAAAVMRRSPDTLTYSCRLCASQFQFGPHVYAGKWLSHYRMVLCVPCYEGNWEGFAPHYEPVIEAHLEAEGIPLPRRNRKGWYPR